MSKADEYRDEMNRLEPQLTEADQQYMSDLRTYFGFGSFGFNEEALNQALLSMMQDLLEAEAAGEDARSLFGDSPKAMADEIMATLPKQRLRDNLPLVGLIVGLSWVFLLLGGGSATKAGMMLSGFSFLLVPVVEALGIAAIFAVIRATVYPQNKWLRKPKVAGGLVGLIFIAVMGIMLLLYLRKPIIWPILVPTPWDYGLLALVTGGYLVFLAREKDANNLPLMVMTLLLAGLAAFALYDAQHPVEMNALTIGLLIGAVAVVIAINWYWTRSMTKK
ncbi:DUF1129 domain-containing protein [Lacticaseibacillus daqingensis]|uniref:DUF1129 family protein n=1 Tax=Lacticaseibacillus daqingensis TaxID=2486014 RepID=UPI000F78F8A4|nr:DUF1129 family protein [Lacticaseibacillus daqingensis]